MMTSLGTQENVNCASQKGKRRKGNPMTTPKQRLIEAVMKRKVTLFNSGVSILEFSHRNEEINNFIKLIEEIIPNE